MAGSAVGTKISHRSRGVVRTDVAITTDAAGDATLTVVGVGFGRLVGVCYNGGLDASANITVRDGKTGAVILSYTTGTEGTPVMFRPTTVVTDVAGTNLVAGDGSGGGTTGNDVNRDLYLGGKVSVSAASGGNLETCILSLIVDEESLGDLALV